MNPMMDSLQKDVSGVALFIIAYERTELNSYHG